VSGPGAELVARLDRVRSKLAALADASDAPSSLTDPDPRTGERWDWGQVWAHIAEFPAYWMEQIIAAVAEGGHEPVPFGRVQSDPGRLAAIERDRTTPLPELWMRISGDLDRLRQLLQRLTPSDWQLRGLHPTLGVMGMPRIVDEFLVGHLEAHAGQLDALLDERE
jgi:hypothetical protein